MKASISSTVFRVILAVALLPAAAGGTLLFAHSTMDPERAWTWSPNIGWVDWYPSQEYGARIGEFVCSGYLWAPNAGWIHLGDGEPEDGIQYSNTSGDDYGVNQVARGRLRGLAWSPNLGWVVFHDQGDPHVDLATGELRGYAWMPNAGWLRLGGLDEDEPGAAVVSVAPGFSSRDDGIPDAWRLRYGGSVDSLPADKDSTGNGMSNRQSYLAGLDPLAPKARFAVTDTRLERDDDGTRLILEWTGSADRAYQVFNSNDLEIWNPVGGPRLLDADSSTGRFIYDLEKEEGEPPPFYRLGVLPPGSLF